jgi:hypothetical protein
MSEHPADAHNRLTKEALKLIATGVETEAQAWVIMESLCIDLGLLYKRDARGTALFVENIAERIVGGERDDAFKS